MLSNDIGLEYLVALALISFNQLKSLDQTQKRKKISNLRLIDKKRHFPSFEVENQRFYPYLSLFGSVKSLSQKKVCPDIRSG